MSRTRLRLVALAIVAFALVASSCFSIRSVKILQQQRLGIGEIAKIQVDLFPLSSDDVNTAYAFILVGLSDLTSPDNTRWDLLGNFGGPIDARRMASLKTKLLADDNCSANGVSATDIAGNYPTWIAIRSDDPIDSSAGSLGDALRIKVEVERPGGTDDDSFGSFVIFSGAWVDVDADVDPTTGDAFECTGLVMSTVAFEASL